MIASKEREFHIKRYVCEVDAMSAVLAPAQMDVLSAEEVSAATVEQFCNLPEHVAKEVVMVLMGHFNFTPVIEKVCQIKT